MHLLAAEPLIFARFLKNLLRKTDRLFAYLGSVPAVEGALFWMPCRGGFHILDAASCPTAPPVWHSMV